MLDNTTIGNIVTLEYKKGILNNLMPASELKKYDNRDNNYLGCIRVNVILTPQKVIPIVFYFFTATDGFYYLKVNNNEVVS